MKSARMVSSLAGVFLPGMRQWPFFLQPAGATVSLLFVPVPDYCVLKFSRREIHG
jgi:hypothetical protein